MIDEFDVFPISQYGAEKARSLSADMRPDVDGPPVGDVTDRTVPGFEDGPEVPVRIYEPGGTGPFPTLVFFHGGGFVLGDLDSHDVACRELVRESDCVVVSVDYRRAPEDPFPAAVEDAYAATQWAAANPAAIEGTGGLAVAGDSAGGTLAAVVAQMARDREDGPAIDYQALVYPKTSHRTDWDSRQENAHGYFLVDEDMRWFTDAYYGCSVHRPNPYAHPLAACDFNDLPPATVITAGFDPLRDEGIAYADALADAGVTVDHYNYDDMIHGFFTMLVGPREVEAGHDAVATVAANVRNALA